MSSILSRNIFLFFPVVTAAEFGVDEVWESVNPVRDFKKLPLDVNGAEMG